MKQTENGWIKLHRKIINWEWYGDPKTCHLFMHLILTANTEPNKWRGERIDRGELVTSLTNLAEETGLTKSEVRTSLTNLAKSGAITRKSTNKFTKITVIGYSDYQSQKKQTGEKNEAEKTEEKPSFNIVEFEKIIDSPPVYKRQKMN